MKKLLVENSVLGRHGKETQQEEWLQQWYDTLESKRNGFLCMGGVIQLNRTEKIGKKKTCSTNSEGIK